MKIQSRLGVTVAGISPGHVAVTVNDGDTVNFTASGTDNQTITAEVKISATAGNIISANVDGIYASASGADNWGSQVIEHDGLSISSGDGTALDPLLVTPLTSVTYAQLAALISGSDLIPGHKYLITDYATVHTIPGTADTNTGATEPLIVTAVSVNELAPIAYSTLHPEDIIHYNPTNNLTAVPGCTKGYILRRIDTINNNDIPTDWRYVKYRRYALNVTDVYDVGTTYDRGDVVIDGIDDTIYISLVDSNLGNALSDEENWITSSTLINGEYISHSITNYVSGGLTIPVNNADFQDYTLFNGTYYAINNKIHGSLNHSDLLTRFNVVVRNYIDGTTVSVYNNNVINIRNTNIIKSFTSNTIAYIDGSTVYSFGFNSGAANIAGCILNTTTNNSFNGTFGTTLSESIIIDCSIDGHFTASLIGNLTSVNTFFNNTIKGTVSFISCTGGMRNNVINLSHDPPSVANFNVTGATHVYGEYTKTWIRTSTGTYRLQYLDGADAIQTVAITA